MDDAPPGTRAVLEVRVLPWRPRRRQLDPDDLREAPTGLLDSLDDVAGLVIGLGIWLAIVLLAPLIVILLAVLLFSVELPLVVAVGVLLLLARFTGLVPWTVLLIDSVSGETRRERYRNGLYAIRRIRRVNHDRRVLVHWHWG